MKHHMSGELSNIDNVMLIVLALRDVFMSCELSEYHDYNVSFVGDGIIRVNNFNAVRNKINNKKMISNLSDEEKSVLLQEIQEVKNTGLVNMFDVLSVQKVAKSLDLHALFDYLSEKENRRNYFKFALRQKTNSPLVGK